MFFLKRRKSAVKLKKIYFFVIQLWEKSQDFSLLSFYEKLIFFLLCFFEIFYRAGFFIVMKYKKFFGGYRLPCKVISVGNLSVGGTGKSVFVGFLVRLLGADKCAVLLRGYKREKTKSLIVDKNRSTILDVGDEALMLARNLSVPVVVGKNRVESARLVSDADYVILDDSYQNFQLEKDFEILLIDARKPFENQHCLPAGPLREKDISRADVIILTHADEVEEKNFPAQSVFTGKHAVVGIRSADSWELVRNIEKSFFAVAGIGSFSGFIASCKNYGLSVCGFCEYPDHHLYTKKDVFNMCQQMTNLSCDGIITTSKDWQKLKMLVGEHKKNFFILEIDFMFLSHAEKKRFKDRLREKKIF